jgi:hypothetical protein
MRWLVAVGIAVGIVGLLGGSMAEAVPVDRLEERYRALTIDGGFDAGDADRLVVLALSDDLLLSRQESEFLRERHRRHAVEEAESLAADGPEEPAVRRARTLMLQALRAGVAGSEYRRAMRQLVQLAMDPELSRTERFRMLELVDRYRRVDPALSTRDALEAIALLLTNPTEAGLDREHRRQLERLEKQFQVPVILDAASRSVR